MKNNLFRKILICLSVLAVVIVSIAQVQKTSFNRMLKLMLSSSTPTIDVPQAALGASTYIFLDARERKEFDVSHIQNARYVGVSEFNMSSVSDLPKNKAIVVYCSIGKRSEDLTLKLKKAGFTNVRNLYGGIFEWVNQGHKVYDTNNKATTNIHAYSKFWGKWLERGTKVY